MSSRIRSVILTAVLVATASGAEAQYFYPGGYGAWGWGGWGGGATAGGDIARGMGMFAAGAGAYNQETAVANQLNSQTVMAWNEYLYNVEQRYEYNRRSEVIRDRKQRNQALAAIQTRLRDNPTDADIFRGDAMNAALSEVTSPKVRLSKYRGSRATVDGKLIRQIPFFYASGAVTASVFRLAREGAPDVLKNNPAFAKEREELRGIAAELREQHKTKGEFESEKLKQAIEALKRAEAKVEATYPTGTRERREAQNYIKGMMGLMRLLDTPAIDVLLAGVEDRPEVSLADLLNFMKAYNLRFGPAETPSQRAAYQTLFPLLDSLRDEVAGPNPSPGLAAAQPPEPPDPAHDRRPGEFFSGMEFQHLQNKPKVQAGNRP